MTQEEDLDNNIDGGATTRQNDDPRLLRIIQRMGQNSLNEISILVQYALQQAEENVPADTHQRVVLALEVAENELERVQWWLNCIVKLVFLPVIWFCWCVCECINEERFGFGIAGAGLLVVLAFTLVLALYSHQTLHHHVYRRVLALHDRLGVTWFITGVCGVAVMIDFFLLDALVILWIKDFAGSQLSLIMNKLMEAKNDAILVFQKIPTYVTPTILVTTILGIALKFHPMPIYRSAIMYGSRLTSCGRQNDFHFFRKVFLSFALLLLVTLSCHHLWNAPIKTSVDSSDFYPTQTLAGLSFDAFEKDFAMATANAPIKDNTMVVAPIINTSNAVEASSIFPNEDILTTVDTACNSSIADAHIDEPVDQTIHDVESILSFESFDVDPPDTAETSSILPYDNLIMDVQSAHPQQEAQDRESDLEMRLGQMPSIQLKLVLGQDESDYERVKLLIVLVCTVIAFGLCVSGTRTVALHAQPQTPPRRTRRTRPTCATPTRFQPHRAAKPSPSPARPSRGSTR